MARSKFPGPVPDEAVDYIRGKDLRVGFSYQDVWGAEHAHGFSVAKIMKLDLLGDVQESLAQAAEQGRPFRDWAKRIRPEMEKRGWWGVKDHIDPKTGAVERVQLGSPQRLHTIYSANMRAARAAGQWQRIQRNKQTHPWLIYLLGPSVHHRKEHVAMEGTTLPVDNPFWSDWYPPKGYGCKCWVRALSHSAYDRLQSEGYQDSLAPMEIDPETGLPTGRSIVRKKPVKTTAPAYEKQTFRNKRTGVTTRVPVGVNPAWAGNVGVNRLATLRDALAGRIDTADQLLARAAVTSVVDSPILPRYIDEVRPRVAILLDRRDRTAIRDAAAPIGQLPIGFLDADLRTRIGSHTQLLRLSPETTAKQIDHHREIVATDYLGLQRVLDHGTALRVNARSVAIYGEVDGNLWRAVLKSVPHRREMYLSTWHRAKPNQFRDARRRHDLLREAEE